MYSRLESTFVESLNASKRRRILHEMFGAAVAPDDGSFDVRRVGSRGADYVRVAASLGVLIGGAGMLHYDIAWGYRCPWTFCVFVSFIAWAVVGSLGGLRSLTRACKGGDSAGSSRLNVGTIMSCVQAVSLLGILVISTISLMGKIHAETDGVLTTLCAAGLLFNALLTQLYYESFSGLFAPIWPSASAPTVLPLFTFSLLAASIYCACVGLQFQPQNLTILRLTNAFRVAAWAFWFLKSWAWFTIGSVASAQRDKGGDISRQEITPLTATPQIVKKQ